MDVSGFFISALLVVCCSQRENKQEDVNNHSYLDSSRENFSHTIDSPPMTTQQIMGQQMMDEPIMGQPIMIQTMTGQPMIVQPLLFNTKKLPS